jgi:hypothetical protein
VIAGADAADAAAHGGTLPDPLAEALRLVDRARATSLHVKLMGGLAFHARCPTWTAQVGRDGRDIDLATRSRDRKGLTELLVGAGYTPDRQYNALYGHKQLYFVDRARTRPVDVLVDAMEMCHRFEFGDRLGSAAPTLPLADLLLTKLQIARINRKDVLDALALLSEYPVADGDEDASISIRRITALTSADWGWWRTVTGNLEKLGQFLATELAPGDLDFGRPARQDARQQVLVLREAIDGAPKSTRWKLRSQVGERVRWYEEPEEVGHGR